MNEIPLAINYALLGNTDAARECVRADEATRLLRSFANRLANDAPVLGKKDRAAMQMMLAKPDQSLTFDDFDSGGISRNTITAVRRKLLAAGYAHLPNGPRGGMALTLVGLEVAKNLSTTS